MRREEGREGGRKRWVLLCIYCLGVMEEGGREGGLPQCIGTECDERGVEKSRV